MWEHYCIDCGNWWVSSDEQPDEACGECDAPELVVTHHAGRQAPRTRDWPL